MDADRLVELIESSIDGAEVVDVGGVADGEDAGAHFVVTVVAPAFAGVPLVEQHSMVYDALGDRMTESVHALDVRTFTPDEYPPDDAASGTGDDTNEASG